MFLPALHHHMHCCHNPFAMPNYWLNSYNNYMMGMSLGSSFMSLASLLLGNKSSNYVGYYPNYNYNFNSYINPSNPFANMNYSLFNNVNYYGGFGSYRQYYQPSVQYSLPDYSYIYNKPFSYNSLSRPQSVQTFRGEELATTTDPTGKVLKKDKKLYGHEFLKKVKQIAKKLNCNYRDLLGVMNSESGISTTAKNPNGSATGLIQFVESTARSLGTTTAALKNMTPLQQLDYVEKYLLQTKLSAGFSSKDKLSAGDLYALVFLPGRAKRSVLTSKGEVYYEHNKGLDRNRDGKITKAELGARVKDHYVNDKTFIA